VIFGLVFLSRDFEVGTDVSSDVSTVSPGTGLIFSFARNVSFLATVF